MKPILANGIVFATPSKNITKIARASKIKPIEEVIKENKVKEFKAKKIEEEEIEEEEEEEEKLEE